MRYFCREEPYGYQKYVKFKLSDYDQFGAYHPIVKPGQPSNIPGITILDNEVDKITICANCKNRLICLLDPERYATFQKVN